MFSASLKANKHLMFNIFKKTVTFFKINNYQGKVSYFFFFCWVMVASCAAFPLLRRPDQVFWL